jgi:two-component system NtrC family response regulator
MDDTALLVVSADRAVAGQLACLVAREGRKVRIALNGTEALEWLILGQFRVLILDVALADLDPLQVAEEVRSRKLSVATLLAARDTDLPRLPQPLPAGISDVVAIPGEPLVLPFQIEQAEAELEQRARARCLARAVRRASNVRGLIAHSPRMDQVVRAVRRLGTSHAPVLISGERGTGRRRIALAIHEGRRSSGPLVHVPCRILPEFLLDLELFGHPRDRLDFDGARGQGALERARGGTLLLSDVETLPCRIQTRLLAALNAKKPQLPGAKGSASCTRVRLLATASPEIAERTAKGTYKKELYDAIAAETLNVPPLRDRSASHVARLIRLFEARLALAGDAARVIPRTELVRLARRTWPGNIQELLQAVESFVRATPADPPTSAAAASLDELATDFHPDEPLPVIVERVSQQVEKAYLCRVLATYGGGINRVSVHCGLSRRTVSEKLRRHAIDKAKYKPHCPGSAPTTG